MSNRMQVIGASSLRLLGVLAILAIVSGPAIPAPPQGQVDNQLKQLRDHTEAALARGDLRSAEMLIETYLPAAQRHADPTWPLFSGHLIACRIKLAMDKADDAERHAGALAAIAARSKRTDTMEHAIAAIMNAQVLQKQGRSPEAAEKARSAIGALRRAHERGRISQRTYETELLAYEDVLIQATTGRTTP